MVSLFTRIIQGEIPCHKILEDEKYLAFLDIHPINPGHTLVIPKQEIDNLFDLEDELLSGLMVFSKKVAKMIKQAVPCERIGVMVCGLEIPHAHVHLIPIRQIKDLNFANAQTVPQEELAEIAARITAE